MGFKSSLRRRRRGLSWRGEGFGLEGKRFGVNKEKEKERLE